MSANKKDAAALHKATRGPYTVTTRPAMVLTPLLVSISKQYPTATFWLWEISEHFTQSHQVIKAAGDRLLGGS